jgi:peptidoglycan-N-acetylglucosamine deacetylase
VDNGVVGDGIFRRAVFVAWATLALSAVLLVGPAAPVAAQEPAGIAGSAGIAGPAGAGPTEPPGGAATAVVKARTAVPVYRHGPRTVRLVALTFDDGYSPTATLKILEVLQSERVPATFFPYGWAVNRNPSVWRKVADAGYPIGNHTQSHRVLTHLSERQVIRELTDARRTIERVTGRPMVPLVRPPGGAWNAATARAAKAAGFGGIVLWDVDPQDWRGRSASTIASRAGGGTSGSIVLLHAGPRATPLALRAIIRSYRARGFTFVTVSQVLGLEPPADATGTRDARPQAARAPARAWR